MSVLSKVVQDEMVNKEALRLHNLLQRFARVRLTPDAVREIQKQVKSHRLQCKARGLDFPELTAFVLPSVGQVQLFRADLDEQSIVSIIANYSGVFSRHVTPVEMVKAVRRAFPHFNPKPLVEQARSSA